MYGYLVWRKELFYAVNWDLCHLFQKWFRLAATYVVTASRFKDVKAIIQLFSTGTPFSDNLNKNQIVGG